MGDLVVKCQNHRFRNVSDGNGSRESKRNALCLRLLGKVADIDDHVLRVRITKALQNSDPVSAILAVFCETFHASYYCPGCKAFMDVSYTAPGYEVKSMPRDESDFGKVMRPKVMAKQMEIA